MRGHKMDFSQNNISSNNSGFGLQANFNNKLSGLNLGTQKNNNNTTYYAKKGEPMYMKEMDADEDGIVSFDEFKDYCTSNGISAKEMVRMVALANSFRTMQAQKRAEKAIEKSEKSGGPEQAESNNEAVYATRGDGKYNPAMDTNNDDKVSYKEYIEYCNEHAQPHEHKTETKVEEGDNGEFKTSNAGKAIDTYSRNESDVPDSFIDELR